MSSLEYEEGSGSSFAAAVIDRFDLDIVRHAIFDNYYIHRLLTGEQKNYYTIYVLLSLLRII